MQGTENIATLVGRVLMSLLFVTSGWGKLLGAAAVQAMFAKQGLPMVQAVWLLAVVIELGGGLLILVGLLTRPAACIATAGRTSRCRTSSAPWSGTRF